MNPEDRLRELRDPDRWMNVRLPQEQSNERTDRTMLFAPRTNAILGGVIAVAAVAGIYLGLTGLAGTHQPPAPAATSSSEQSTPSASFAPSSSTPTLSPTSTPPTAGAPCGAQSLNIRISSSGAGAGSWVAMLAVTNSGATCTLQASDLRVGSWAGRAAQTDRRTGFTIEAGKTTTLTLLANTTCPSGATNIASKSATAPLTLGSGAQTKTIGTFPKLSCSGPVINQL